MHKKILLTILLTTTLTMAAGTAYAQTQIYRSVGPSKTTAVDDDNGHTETITIDIGGPGGDTATFNTAAVATNVGVGDIILYDSEEDNDLDGSDSIVFIHGRTSSTVFTVKEHDGSVPSNTTTANDYWAIYRAHTSLSNAESGTVNSTLSGMGFSYNGGDRNIDTNNEVWNIACYANGTTADSTAVTIDGWNTDTDNYIKIYTPISTSEVGTSQRHSGKWDTNKYLLSLMTTQLEVKEGYVRIDGLQFNNPGSGNADSIQLNASGLTVDLRVSNCIIRSTNSSVNKDGVAVLIASNGNAYIWNNIIYGFLDSGSKGIWDNTSSVNVFAYNNTIYNSTRGIYGNGTSTYAKNNITQNCADGYYNIFNSASDYNISDIAGDQPASGSNDKMNTVVDFVDRANDDFHLATTDSAARDAGTSDPGSGLFSDDIDGETRNVSGLGWDIGADETGSPIYRSVAPNKTTAVDDDNSQSETLTISGSTATFNTAGVSNGVGVGDVILYDSQNDNDLDGSDSIVFIHGRTDSQNFTVKQHDGAVPSNTTTTNDYWAIYRAHTSLSNAEAGTENSTLSTMGFSYNGGNRDLVTSGEQWNIACYANGTTADSTAVIINTWTTGPQNYIRIYTPYLTSEVGTSQRHKGKWDSTKYNMVVSEDDVVLILVQDENVRIDGLQVYMSSSSNTKDGIFADSMGGVANFYVSNNIVRGPGVTTQNPWAIGTNLSNPESKVYYWNNIAYDFYNATTGSATGICTNYLNVNCTFYIYNNTVYYVRRGIRRSYGTAILKNNITQDCVDGYYGTFTIRDYNISDVSQADADSANTTFNGYKTVSFVDSANYDFHLAASDTSAKDAGTDLSSDSNLAFNDDIDGHTRNPDGLGWDIGADEYVSNFGFDGGLKLEGLKID